MPDLRECLRVAAEHWSDRPGDKVMCSMASRTCALVGLSREAEALKVADGVKLLADLRKAGLSPKSVRSYYQAFRRVLTLNGVSSELWPKAPTPPKRTRDRLSDEDLDRLIAWFREPREASGAGSMYSYTWAATADLALLLRGTGMRINVEAVTKGKFRVTLGEWPPEAFPASYDILHITGKGDNEREIPVVEPKCRALLRDPLALTGIQSLTYSAHMKRWSLGIASLGILSRLPTPHAVRHAYASEALENSGGNLELVRGLLGHTSPATTSGYLHIDQQAKADALAPKQKP